MEAAPQPSTQINLNEAIGVCHNHPTEATLCDVIILLFSLTYFPTHATSTTFKQYQQPFESTISTSIHIESYQKKKKKISKQKSGMLISKQYQQVCLVHDTKKFHSNRIILRFPNTHKGKICKHSYHIYSKFRLNLLVYPLILLIQKKKKKKLSHIFYASLLHSKKKYVVI